MRKGDRLLGVERRVVIVTVIGSDEKGNSL